MAEQKTTDQVTVDAMIDRTEDGLIEFDEQLALEEKLIVNMGPSHPSTHGVLRIILTLAGEEIEEAEIQTSVNS